MQIKYLLSIFIISCCVLPAIAASCTSLNSISWLLGEWSSEGTSDYTVEVWEKVSEMTFEGYARKISLHDNSERNFETLRLVQMSDQVFYIAKVNHNMYPVSFILTGCSDTTAVFENPDHDFPQKITYNLIDSHSISVTVGSDSNYFRLDLYRKSNR